MLAHQTLHRFSHHHVHKQNGARNKIQCATTPYTKNCHKACQQTTNTKKQVGAVLKPFLHRRFTHGGRLASPKKLVGNDLLLLVDSSFTSVGCSVVQCSLQDKTFPQRRRPCHLTMSRCDQPQPSFHRLNVVEDSAQP